MNKPNPPTMKITIEISEADAASLWDNHYGNLPVETIIEEQAQAAAEEYRNIFIKENLPALIEKYRQHLAAKTTGPTIKPEQRQLASAILIHAKHNNPDLDHHTQAIIRVLGSVIEGVPVERAMGAPGDWGYGTPIGDALLALLQSR